LKRLHRHVTRLDYRLRDIRHRLRHGRPLPPVVFIHTLKTAGSSINFYFKNYIGSARSGRVVLFDEVDYGRADIATLTRAARARYVSGHLSWAAFEAFHQPGAYAFTFMRDPVERLFSLYYYFKSFPHRDAERIRELARRPIEEFFAIDDPAIRFYTENFVVRQFAGATAEMFVGRELEAAVERARAHLETLDRIGFVHSLDHDFRDIARACGLPAPQTVPKHNVTAAFQDAADREDRARRMSDPKLLAILEPLIVGDRALYEHFVKKASEPQPGATLPANGITSAGMRSRSSSAPTSFA
jgi:hypothetical protein